MENISHAESAAGSPGWKASGLLLLVVGIFFFPLRALKFAASRAWKSVWGEMCAEICAEMQQGAQSPDPHLAVLMQGCCAGMLCRVLCRPFLQAPVVTAPPWDGFFVPGGWREAVELLLCLEVALEKDNIRVEEASWPVLLPCVGCPSAETKLWAPVAPFLTLHAGASTQNSGAFHFPKSRFPSSCFFFPPSRQKVLVKIFFILRHAQMRHSSLQTRNEVESAAFAVTPLWDFLLYGGGDVWAGRRCTLQLPMDVEADVSGWQR